MEIETTPRSQPLQRVARQSEAFKARTRPNNCCGRVFTVGGYVTAAGLCVSGIALLVLKRNHLLATGLLCGGGGLVIVDAVLGRLCCSPATSTRKRERKTLKRKVVVDASHNTTKTSEQFRSSPIQDKKVEKKEQKSRWERLKVWKKKEKPEIEAEKIQTGERRKINIETKEIIAKGIKALASKDYSKLIPIIDKLQNNWECIKEDDPTWTVEELAVELQDDVGLGTCTPVLIKFFEKAIEEGNKGRSDEKQIDPRSEFSKDQIDQLLQEARNFINRQQSKKK